MKALALSLLASSIYGFDTDSITHLEVFEGDFYSSPFLKVSYHTDKVVEARIKLGDTAGTYWIPHEGHETDQVRCLSSWNKLWGYSRCLGSLHHEDSDRFVWRRNQYCLQYKDGQATYITDCGDGLDYYELAAYAYDNSLKPFQHLGTLLKQFDTKVKVDTFYKYKLTFDENSTTYDLLQDDGTHLETLVIDHRSCYLPESGYRLWLYFGGVCPAPVDIEGWYQIENE